MPWRKIGTIVLVVITSLVVLVASIAVWGSGRSSTRDRFTKVVASALDDPAVTGALATRLTDSAFDAAQSTGVVADNVPSQLQPLIPVIRGALQSSSRSRSTASSRSDTGQQIIVLHGEAFHSAAMRVLDGENPGNSVNIENGPWC